MHPLIADKLDDLNAFCLRWKVQELSVFGSLVHGDFGPQSDVDLLVTFLPDHTPGWGDYCAMTDELERMFGRSTDLVFRSAVEKSENYIRRRHILKSMERLYVA